MAFKNHYLGPNNIGNMAATAEHNLINAACRGEGRHWDFERYATLHKEQHIILEGLKEYGYAGMDEGSKQGTYLLGSREADCHVKQTEPYSPWQNAAVGTIRELKKSAGRKMIKLTPQGSCGMIA